MITLELNQTQFFPGQTVRGDLFWTNTLETRPRPAMLTIGWRTEGRGTVDRDGFKQSLDLIPQRRVSFAWEIPPKAPLSYDGDLIRILWEVTVTFTEKDKLPRNFGDRLKYLAQGSPPPTLIQPFRVIGEWQGGR